MQGGVDIIPGSGGVQSGVSVSPAKVAAPRAKVRATAAISLFGFFKVFSLTSWFALRFSVETNKAKQVSAAAGFQLSQ